MQVIRGHVFPHPEDDRWKDEGTFMTIGPLQVGSNTLWVGDVKVFEDIDQLSRYRVAIYDASQRRRIAKALEAIP